MQDLAPNLLDLYRGRLPRQSVGARGLVRLARNPQCERLRVLTTASVSPSSVAREVYQFDPREGQSPFAFAAGNQFEAAILKNDAHRLQQAYREAGLALATPANVAFVEEIIPGRGEAIQARRLELTEGFIRGRLNGNLNAPDVIIKPRLGVWMLGSSHLIEPDALVALMGAKRYLPVEIKSYPDRESKTDPSDIRTACLQAAVAHVAVRQVLARVDVPSAEDELPRGHLVLRKPGRYWPVVRPMTLGSEVNLLERVLMSGDDAATVVGTMLDRIKPRAALDDPAVLNQIGNHFSDSCLGTCSLAPKCKSCAVSAGDLAVIGDVVREDLLPTKTIHRALELLHATGNQPENDQEAALAERLRGAVAIYREVLGDGR